MDSCHLLQGRAELLSVMGRNIADTKHGECLQHSMSSFFVPLGKMAFPFQMEPFSIIHRVARKNFASFCHRSRCRFGVRQIVTAGNQVNNVGGVKSYFGLVAIGRKNEAHFQVACVLEPA